MLLFVAVLVDPLYLMIRIIDASFLFTLLFMMLCNIIFFFFFYFHSESTDLFLFFIILYSMAVI